MTFIVLIARSKNQRAAFTSRRPAMKTSITCPN
jgi:hypothetical protein